jgi:light-harvesting complex I chlorophyll a/b binding protein 4
VTDAGAAMAMLKDDYIPGDLKFDPLGLNPKDKAEKKAMATKEINNGMYIHVDI